MTIGLKTMRTAASRVTDFASVMLSPRSQFRTPARNLQELGIDSLAPWRRSGGRPRIARPLEAVVVGRDVVIEIDFNGLEPIEGVAVVDTGSQGSGMLKPPPRLYYKIDLGREERIDLREHGIRLPSGMVRVSVGIRTSPGEPFRFSQPRSFQVRDNPAETEVEATRVFLGSADFDRVLTPGSPDYEALRARFRQNLQSLSYDENLELRKREIAEGRSVLCSVPPSAQLLLGRRCNADCIMCDEGRNPDLSTIPSALMEDLPNLLPFMHSLSLVGGEPLVFKEAARLVADLRRYPNLTIGLGTNASLLLDRDWADVLLEGHFDMSVSLDAARKETFERIRRKLSWDRVIAGLEYLRDNRKGPYPQFGLTFVTMRSNYREIVPFVDLAHRLGAKSVYYNLMMPGQIDVGFEDESLHGDVATCREVAFYIREAHKRARELGLSCSDKVLGWLLPRHPELILGEDDLKVMDARGVAEARARIPQNVADDELFWKRRGGYPSIAPLPESAQGGRRENAAAAPDERRPFPYLTRDLPDGFFCMAPFDMLNLNVENSFVCCHAKWPLNHITYGQKRDLFDVWNHPMMQFARRTMFDGDAVDKLCKTACPHFRKGGRK